jgi:hypothetical protein
MRLTLSVLFMTILLAIPAVVLADAIFERESLSETAASRVGTRFVWPEHPRAADPQVALRILAEAAEATGSNVLRTTVSTSRSERKSITHYIFMGGDRTDLFTEFTLTEGRWLTAAESRTGTTTVSSTRPGERDNIGVPAVFAGRYELTFAPLRRAFDSLSSAGRYVVESRGDAVGDRFLTIVAQRLVDAGVPGPTIGDLAPEHLQDPTGHSQGLKVLAYVLGGLSTLVIAFILLREGKRIGVLRLLGHPTTRIWYEVAGQLQLVAVLVGLGACGIVALAVPGADTMFLRTLAVTFAEVAVVGFAATMTVGLIVINRVRVTDLVKGGLQ